MARAKKTKEINPRSSSLAPSSRLEDVKVIELPYALRRELEEISKNSGRVIDYSLPVSELEQICNKANNPPDAWRYRWE